MPYYHWRAIDLAGDEHAGCSWAPSIYQLEQDLLNKQLGLMLCTRKKLYFVERLSAEQQLQLLEQLALLLNAGLLIWQALSIVSRYGPHLRRLYTEELQRCVQSGSSFFQALSQFPRLIDPLALNFIRSGQESGSLAPALNHAVSFLRMRADMRKKFHDAFRTPLVTLGFFCAIVLIIFLAIIPSFENIFVATSQVPDPNMQKLFDISRTLTSYGILTILGILLSCGIILILVNKLPAIHRVKQWCYTHIPGIAGLYWTYTCAGFFQAVALLVRSGMPLLSAMQTAQEIQHNYYIKKQLLLCIELVNGGLPLDQAFEQTCSSRAHPDVTPLLAVGSASGMLATVLEQSARLYFEHAQQQINRLVIFVQPVLMGLLGLLVALLLYNVYLPIIQLPQTFSAVAL